MTLELQLNSETEAKIRARAAATGQDVATFVLQAVNERLANAELQPSSGPRRDQDWHEKLRAIIDLHPTVTHFVDDSRESIYAGRGE